MLTPNANDQTRSDTKQYYTIGEVAQHFQVSASLIRFWEKHFPSLKPKKDRQGHRRYTKTDMAQFQRIHHLVKEQGYTLQGAKEALKHQKLPPEHQVALKDTLKTLRTFLVALKARL